jgi:hypothetical protein
VTTYCFKEDLICYSGGLKDQGEAANSNNGVSGGSHADTWVLLLQ